MNVLAAIFTALALPGFSPFTTGPDGGQVLEGTFPGTLRPGYVYVPPNFDPAARYPVVYLLHGLPGGPVEYIGSLDLAAVADAAISAGTLKPFIAVIPAAAANARYAGEWAGTWEQAVVDQIVPWVDAHLPTIRTASGRVIAGLSAGGYGAVDIALRHPTVFGEVESWSGYFTALRDEPFTHADAATLAANNPSLLVRREASQLRALEMRFFVSTGPYHSHLIGRGTTQAFAAELRSLRLPVKLEVHAQLAGEWSDQMDDGLRWAFGT
jgi:enterochelin esterase-like enzyme